MLSQGRGRSVQGLAGRAHGGHTRFGRVDVTVQRPCVASLTKGAGGTESIRHGSTSPLDGCNWIATATRGWSSLSGHLYQAALLPCP